MKALVFLIGVALAASLLAAPEGDPEFAARLAAAEQQSRAGNLHLAVKQLEQLRAAYPAAAPAEMSRAANALGVAYYRMGKYGEAEPLLECAFKIAPGATEKARFAIDLGNLYAARRNRDEAERNRYKAERNRDEAEKWYRQGRTLAPQDASLQVAARLNLARLVPVGDRLALLAPIFLELPKVEDERERARYALNIGAQAAQVFRSPQKVDDDRERARSALNLEAQALKLAYEAFELAREAAASLPDPRLLAESLDGLSQLYEDQGRDAEALRLANQGTVIAQSADAREVLIELEWRRGRLFERSEEDEQARLAYQRAVDHIEAIRQSIPVVYQDGTSSFTKTLEPVYQGLGNLQLTAADKKKNDDIAQQCMYQQARTTLELMKQSELEDFLGNRCTPLELMKQSEPEDFVGERCTRDAVKAVKGAQLILPEGTAVLYPIIFPDRLELLLETPQRIDRFPVEEPRQHVEEATKELAKRLRDPPPTDRVALAEHKRSLLPALQELYRWLVGPIEEALETAKINTLIFLPDGWLRLIPIGVLHDGSRYAVQKLAVATVPGLRMARVEPAKGQRRALLAGLTEPGPKVKDILGEKRKLFEEPLLAVELELKEVSKKVKAEVLLNDKFTLDRFEKEVTSGEYRMVHIASHGNFGRSGSAEDTFVMTYDKLLTLDRLQDLLRDERMRDQPIDLLTLSACRTAEGDDRAPLGFAGAAIKLRAKSALGTLWPVDDDSAAFLLPHFYEALAQPGTTKINALQQAQLRLINDPDWYHPNYWAPFILVGSWQ